MSPYQQDVIGVQHYQEYDIQAQKGLQGISSSKLLAAGAFGGGTRRCSKSRISDLHQIEIELHYKLNLLQQGFGQAQGVS
jgi:hypothetical protein